MSRLEEDREIILNQITTAVRKNFACKGTLIERTGSIIAVTQLGKATLEEIQEYAAQQVPAILSGTLNVPVQLLEQAA